MSITYDRQFIGGEWVAPASAAVITVTSASTEETIGSVPKSQEADVDAAVDAARRAFDDPYSDDDNAVRIANSSNYGLAGSVWTSDPERGQAIACRLETGTVGINRYLPDPGAPFAGRKTSGLSHELEQDAVAAYQQFKSIYS